MGGHVSWLLLSHERKITLGIPIVGCPGEFQALSSFSSVTFPILNLTRYPVSRRLPLPSHRSRGLPLSTHLRNLSNPLPSFSPLSHRHERSRLNLLHLQRPAPQPLSGQEDPRHLGYQGQDRTRLVHRTLLRKAGGWRGRKEGALDVRRRACPDGGGDGEGREFFVE